MNFCIFFQLLIALLLIINLQVLRLKKKTFQKNHFKKMEICPTSILVYERSIIYNHELRNTHLPGNNQWYCQQNKFMINLTDKRSHLQSNENKNKKKCRVVRHV